MQKGNKKNKTHIDISPGVWYDTDIIPGAIIVETKLPYLIYKMYDI